DPIAKQLEDALHPYLRERLGPRLAVTPTAGLDEIRRAVTGALAEIERGRERELVAQLRDGVARGHRAVAGLGPVLGALAERRVDRLLVSHGYSETGWHCGACDALADVGRACPRCGAEMDHLDDVVEEAIEQALTQGC